MAKLKQGDRVVCPAHQEGPAGPVHVVVDKSLPDGIYRVLFDTGVRYPDGTPLEKTSMSTFEESELNPM
jgi:hypothetical protein